MMKLIWFEGEVPRQLSVMHVGCGPGSFISGPWQDAMRETGLFRTNWIVPSRDAQNCEVARQHFRLKRSRVSPNLEWLLMASQERLGLQPDLVAITTPTDQHAEQIITASRFVKYIVCDKPVVTSLDEYKRVKSAVDENGCKVIVTYNHRFFAPVFALKQLVQQRSEVHSLSSWFLQDWLMDDPKIRQSKWRLEDPWCGLLDIGTHAADLQAFVLGEFPVAVVNATKGTWGQHGYNCIDNGVAELVYPSGLVGMSKFHQALPGHADDIGIKVGIGNHWYMWRLEWGADALWLSVGDGDEDDRGQWTPVLRGTTEFGPNSVAFAKTPPGHVLGWPDSWYHLFASVAGLIHGGNLPSSMTLPLPMLDFAGEFSTRYCHAHVMSADAGGERIRLNEIG